MDFESASSSDAASSDGRESSSSDEVWNLDTRMGRVPSVDFQQILDLSRLGASAVTRRRKPETPVSDEDHEDAMRPASAALAQMSALPPAAAPSPPRPRAPDAPPTPPTPPREPDAPLVAKKKGLHHNQQKRRKASQLAPAKRKPDWAQHTGALLLAAFALSTLAACAAARLRAPKSPSSWPCKDVYPDNCTSYATAGACQTHPGWMIAHCAETCQRCDLRDPRKRCNKEFLNLTKTPPAFPGGLTPIFESLVTDPKWAKFGPRVLSRDPWVVVFDTFLETWECDELVAAPGLSFSRSTDMGAFEVQRGAFRKVVSSKRTSSNAWCNPACEATRAAKAISGKLFEAVGVGAENWESMQLVRYEAGQQCGPHHDFVVSPGESAFVDVPGPRVLTFLLYLSDVEGGGETRWPSLNLEVAPKKGRAVLWPSVDVDDLLVRDGRTTHQALPVTAGLKHAANAWVHLHNYRIPNVWGCTGIFDTLDDSNVDQSD